MSINSFGRAFVVTTFGESHGHGIGVVIDGCPSGVTIAQSDVQAHLDRRKPGQSTITTARREPDKVDIISGLFDSMTTGAPLAMFINNHDAQSDDYAHLKDAPRPSHADYTYRTKFGHTDLRGGGRASARETAARVAAGAVAHALLAHYNIEVRAWVKSVHAIDMQEPSLPPTRDAIEATPVRCPDRDAAQRMIDAIEDAKTKGDSLGGVVAACILGCPAGLGEPIYYKVEASLAAAMLSINASKGFCIGSGFRGTRMTGRAHNDAFVSQAGTLMTATNHSGGVQGGITNGMPITFEVAFKPTATLMQDQASAAYDGKKTLVKGRGRHDPCVLPRAVAVVEAMAACVMADHVLLNRMARL